MLRISCLITTAVVLSSLAGPICAAPVSGMGSSRVIYREGFEGAIGPEWGIHLLDTAPESGRRFLGQFHEEEVDLTLAGLPSHRTVGISFDLCIIRTWDGNQGSEATGELSSYLGSDGPDRWQAQIRNGPVLLEATFDNHDESNRSQSFPDAHPGGDHPPRTGAVETDTLGYADTGSLQLGVMDAVYHLDPSAPHTSPGVTFDFTASLPDSDHSLKNESWGIDNVEVWVAE